MTHATEGMKITALAPWFGSKRTLAPRIVAELGKHSAYIEPFCGSMAVLLAKPLASVEVVNDLNANIINLARVIRCPKTGPQFYRRVRRWIMYEGVIDDAKAMLRDGGIPPVDRAVAYFAMSWLGLNGYSGTEKELQNVNTAKRYTLLGGGAPVTRFRSAVGSVPAFAKRLRNVDIRSEDGIALLERLSDSARQAIYVDPPYLKKGASYLHDFDWLAHRRLAKVLARFQSTRIVVSYYDHPDLAAMYPADRWTKIDCAMTKALVSQGRRDSTHKATAPEVLLVNGASFAEAIEPEAA